MVQVHGCTHTRTGASRNGKNSQGTETAHRSLREKASSEDGNELSSALIG